MLGAGGDGWQRCCCWLACAVAAQGDQVGGDQLLLAGFADDGAGWPV
ncbi:hypothetical protein ULG90_06615 [Halopseudomonas pachastrellae]|nr:hypothetical protein ULG90_06615 [Halopseudomonas pachastrellae]